MNKDQANSTLRSLLKVIGGILMAHGATKAAAWINTEDAFGLFFAVIGFIWSHYQHGDQNAPNPIVGPGSKLPLFLGYLLLALGLTGLTGCASSRVVTMELKPDGSSTSTEVTARTFFDSKSELTKPKALVTDKTSSSQVGSMSQESSGSNTVQTVHILIEGVSSGAAKALIP